MEVEQPQSTGALHQYHILKVVFTYGVLARFCVSEIAELKETISSVEEGEPFIVGVAVRAGGGGICFTRLVVASPRFFL